jgi:hypothetical protein
VLFEAWPGESRPLTVLDVILNWTGGASARMEGTKQAP